jgi:hypothetical protein
MYILYPHRHLYYFYNLNRILRKLYAASLIIDPAVTSAEMFRLNPVDLCIKSVFIRMYGIKQSPDYEGDL